MKRCELSRGLPAVVSDAFVCLLDANLRVIPSPQAFFQIHKCSSFFT